LLRSELGQHIGTAYNNSEYFPDLEIVVSYSHTNQSDVIRAHRCILAVRSPVLRSRLLALAPGTPLNLFTDKTLQLLNAFFKYPHPSLFFIFFSFFPSPLPLSF
jgi:hypothetical protein